MASPFAKGGLRGNQLTNMHESHPQTSGLRLPDLKPEVQSYIAKLKKSLFVIYAKYEVKNRNELAVKVREGKVDSKDSDKVIELLKVINECGRQDKTIGREFEAQLIEQESQKLEDFFGRKIEVPPLPDEITPERLAEWKEKKLELHYLPDIDMAQEYELKNWKIPDFPNISKSDLPKDIFKLPGCWVLVDARTKPEYRDGNQNYSKDEDFLGSVLEDLRNKGLIKQFKHSQSRFNISSEELEKPEVISAIAEACGLEPEQVSTPRMIELNVIGNIHHSEWRFGCSEWFSDKCKMSQVSDYGDLNCVYWRNPDDRRDVVGFRAIGRFVKVD